MHHAADLQTGFVYGHERRRKERASWQDGSRGEPRQRSTIKYDQSDMRRIERSGHSPKRIKEENGQNGCASDFKTSSSYRQRAIPSNGLDREKKSRVTNSFYRDSKRCKDEMAETCQYQQAIAGGSMRGHHQSHGQWHEFVIKAPSRGLQQRFRCEDIPTPFHSAGHCAHWTATVRSGQAPIQQGVRQGMAPCWCDSQPPHCPLDLDCSTVLANPHWFSDPSAVAAQRLVLSSFSVRPARTYLYVYIQ